MLTRSLLRNYLPRPPDSEKRLQVLQDIASEFTLKWDSSGFEQTIASPSVVEQIDNHEEIVAQLIFRDIKGNQNIWWNVFQFGF
ncbi:hypothetical protein OROMI_018742 [Orobanche minor]